MNIIRLVTLLTIWTVTLHAQTNSDYDRDGFRFSLQVQAQREGDLYRYDYTLRQVDTGRSIYRQLKRFALVFPDGVGLRHLKEISTGEWSVEGRGLYDEPALAQSVYQLRLRPGYDLTPDGDGTSRGESDYRFTLISPCSPSQGQWIATGEDTYDFADTQVPCNCSQQAGVDESREPESLSERETPAKTGSLRVTRTEIIVETDTILRVRLEDRLSSEGSASGDSFTATLVDDLMAGDQRVLPAGTVFQGRVVSATPAAKGNKPGSLSIAFEKVRLPSGRTIDIDAEPRSIDEKIDAEGRISRSGSKRVAIFVGGGAAGGAAIGAIAGGGKGAGIGAAIGAGVGILSSVLVKGPEVNIERGTLFGLYLTEPLRIPNAGLRSPNRSRQPGK